jgi:hypothetical protein
MTKLVLLKKQEAWENKVRIAAEHERLIKANLNLFISDTKDVVRRYKIFLERNKMESIIDLKQYI